MKKLVIISHTEHYLSDSNDLVGWGPTVSEINNLLKIFDKIYHVAMFYNTTAPASALPYQDNNRIKFIRLPPLGGNTFYKKFELILNSYKILKIINKTLSEDCIFQFRAPTGIGLYVIPFLIYRNNIGWFKYAGNWNQKYPPLGYWIQRKLLKNQNRPVTINGAWENQPDHCLSFENPCLTYEDILNGKIIRNEKNFKGKLNFCFVGRLEKPKGVELIINALNHLEKRYTNKIGTINFVGEGREHDYFELLAKKSDLHYIFHGSLKRDKVFEIYKTCHIFLLPTTASEGFPKVIAEAMNFGCIPIVSSISSINQYIIDGMNGILIKNLSKITLKKAIVEILHWKSSKLKNMIYDYNNLVEKFSFNMYNKRIRNEILNN